jgi:hypothetical protein
LVTLRDKDGLIILELLQEPARVKNAKTMALQVTDKCSLPAYQGITLLDPGLCQGQALRDRFRFHGCPPKREKFHAPNVPGLAGFHCSYLCPEEYLRRPFDSRLRPTRQGFFGAGLSVRNRQ